MGNVALNVLEKSLNLLLKKGYEPCKPVLLELKLFLIQKFSFVPTNLRNCWPRAE